MLLILILKIAFEIAFDLNMVYIASQWTQVYVSSFNKGHDP